MNKVLLHSILLLCTLCLGSIACSEETVPQPATDGGDGQLRITYKIAGTSTTRASFGEEPGLTGWNENKIVRVDLFVFTTSGAFHKHIEDAANDNEPPLSNKDDGSYTTLTTDALTYEEVHDGDYIYYMVANCEQLASVDKPTLSELQAMMINSPFIAYNTTQTRFVMDGKGEVDIHGDNITLSFGLKRAAAKIRLTVLDEDDKDITEQCSFRLHNYVPQKAWVLAREEREADEADDVNAFYDLSVVETDIQRESMSTATEYHSLLNRDNQVVFYSYPNDWFDESKAHLANGAWTIDDYTTADPILRDRQTYILLEAPYDGVDYHYEIPVNLSTYENNDAASFTGAQYKEIRDLYRLQRNHIYDITAKIDRRGGGLDLTCNVLEWDNGGSIDISYDDAFAGTLTLTTATRVFPDDAGTTEENEEALAVVYGDDEKWATFTFRMTKPVAATWTANLTDGSHFELYSPTGMASGIGVGDSAGSEEGLVTFTIRPTQEYSVDETYETELYISVLSVNGEHLGEQEINPETHYPGTLMRIKIRQVSLDQWNGLSAQTQP